jgi:hypothetical protein
VGFKPRCSNSGSHGVLLDVSGTSDSARCVCAAVRQAGNRTRPDERCFPCIVCAPGRAPTATFGMHVVRFGLPNAARSKPQAVLEPLSAKPGNIWTGICQQALEVGCSHRRRTAHHSPYPILPLSGLPSAHALASALPSAHKQHSAKG